jgi:hypothetical protein
MRLGIQEWTEAGQWQRTGGTYQLEEVTRVTPEQQTTISEHVRKLALDPNDPDTIAFLEAMPLGKLKTRMAKAVLSKVELDEIASERSEFMRTRLKALARAQRRIYDAVIDATPIPFLPH